MKYALRIAEGLRSRIRQFSEEHCSAEHVGEWVEHVRRLCENPQDVKLLPAADIMSAGTYTYGFQLGHHMVMYALDIDHDAQIIDVVDFRYALIM